MSLAHALALLLALLPAATGAQPPGDPVTSPDGRLTYQASPEGWITLREQGRPEPKASVRAGQAINAIALSSDGRWLLVASREPPAALLFDARLNPVKQWPGASRDGKRVSPVGSVVDAPRRQSFVVALSDVAELWEISYDPKAEDIYEGLVHDYRMGEGLPMRGFHNLRRTALAEPLQDVTVDEQGIHAIGTPRARAGVAPTRHVINLDVRRQVATLPARPNLAASAAMR